MDVSTHHVRVSSTWFIFKMRATFYVMATLVITRGTCLGKSRTARCPKILEPERLGADSKIQSPSC